MVDTLTEVETEALGNPLGHDEAEAGNDTLATRCVTQLWSISLSHLFMGVSLLIPLLLVTCTFSSLVKSFS